MRRAIYLLFVLGLILPVLNASATTDTATASMAVTVANSGPAMTYTRAEFPLSAQGLIDTGFMTPTGLDAEITDSSGNTVPYMPSTGSIIPQYALAFDQPSTYFNQSTAAQTGTGNLTLMQAAPAVGDAYLVGFYMPSRVLRIETALAGAGTYTITWEYTQDGTTWIALSGVTDGTNGFRNGGIQTVTWTMPQLWPQSTVNSLTSYWARGRVSAYTSSTVIPIGQQIWTDSGYYSEVPAAVSAGANFSSTLYTGLANSEDRTFHHYVGGNNGITLGDGAPLEPGSLTWEIVQVGYYNTSAGNVGGEAFEKKGALSLYVSAANELTAAIYGATTTTSAPVPNQDYIEGAYTVSGCTSTTQYACVNASDANYLSTNSGGFILSSFGVVDPGFAAGTHVTQVEVLTDFRCADGGGGCGAAVTILPSLTLDGYTRDGAGGATALTTYQTDTQTIARPGASSRWLPTDLARLRVQMQAKGNGSADENRIDFIRLRVTYATPTASVNVPVTSGNHQVVFGVDASNLYLYADAGTPDTTAKVAVQNTAFAWLFAPGLPIGAAMAAQEGVSYTLNGTTLIVYQLVGLPTYTIADDSGNGNTGSPSYPETFNAAVLGSTGPLTWTTPAAASSGTEPQPDVLPVNSLTPTDSSVTGGTVSNFWLFPMFQQIETTYGWPAAFFLYFFMLVSTAAATLIAVHFSRGFIMFPAIACVGMLVFWFSMGVIPLWPVFLLAFIWGTIVILGGKAPTLSSG